MTSAGWFSPVCFSCHVAPHLVQTPNFDVGLGYNCSGCHMIQASDNKMGPDCARCHANQIDPHLVVK